jgi:Alpha-acetolactate decarboxylase
MNNQLLKQEKIRSERVAGETQSLYQISTSTALVEGVHSGSVSSSVLLEHGDFGLGTFEDLDGEMVILDGESVAITPMLSLIAYRFAIDAQPQFLGHD